MRAGGMEYPTFMTTGGSEPVSFLGIANVELLTIHELGHQWFQGMVATNEMDHPFLDEGVTSYVESRYLEERFGAGSLLNWPWLKVSRLAGSRYMSLRRPGRQPINSSAPELKSFQAIGSLVYARSTLVLETLARVYGKDKLHAALSHYAERYRFKNPKPRDFYRVIGEFLGKKAQRQAQLMFDAQGWTDFSLSAVETREKVASFVSTVTVERAGNLDLPAVVRVRFRDGTQRDFPFSTGQNTETFVVDHQSPIRWAEVDPEQGVLLDENLENNRKVPRGGFVDRDQQFQSALALLSWVLSWMTL
jgi:aminopeptidase N